MINICIIQTSLSELVTESFSLVSVNWIKKVFVFVSETSGIETHREREKERENILQNLPNNSFSTYNNFCD